MKAQFEKVSLSADSSFRLFSYEENEFDAPWHFHPEYELTYIVNSRGMRYVGDSVKRFTEDDLVLLGSNLPHCWKNTATYEGKAQSVVIQFREDMLGNERLMKKEFYAIRHMLDVSAHGLHFKPQDAKNVQPLILEMLAQPAFERYLSLLKILNRLAHLPCHILSESSNAHQLNHKANERVNQIYNFVAKNYRKKISLHDIASYVAMNEEAFCRFCKKTLKKSFFTFLNEYRINQACDLLMATELSITQVGYDCGYESLPFFYRQFQKFNECSPAVYRRHFKKELA